MDGFEVHLFSQMEATAPGFQANGIVPNKVGHLSSRHGAGHNIATYHRDPEGNLIELFTDAEVFIPELNMFEPRPWHETIPQRPRVWRTDECITRWGTAFEEALV